ncbi:MAG: hypothetical protein AAGA32_22580 [Pseudomonadota bacterium]
MKQVVPTKEPLESYIFLNPGFEPDGIDLNHHRQHPVSELAHKVFALVETARFATENDTSGTPLDRRGIASTLEIVGFMASDLIIRCEELEGRLRDATKPEVA